MTRIKEESRKDKNIKEDIPIGPVCVLRVVPRSYRPALLLPPASIPLLPLPVLSPSLLVPFRPVPGTLCNHKAN